MASNSEIFAESEFLLPSCDSAYLMGDLTESQIGRACENLAKACFMNGGNNFQSVKRVFVD